MTYSLFVPKSLRPDPHQLAHEADILKKWPLATLEGEGSFRRELAGLARSRHLRMNIQVECSSLPMAASALESGNGAAILPSMAAVVLERSGIVELKSGLLSGFEKELCLAWNPRLLRIRTVLDKASKVFSRAFQI